MPHGAGASLLIGHFAGPYREARIVNIVACFHGGFSLKPTTGGFSHRIETTDRFIRSDAMEEA